jgi:hypothetical protein
MSDLALFRIDALNTASAGATRCDIDNENCFCRYRAAYLDVGEGSHATRDRRPGKVMVPRGGIEPPTHGFSVRCSTN